MEDLLVGEGRQSQDASLIRLHGDELFQVRRCRGDVEVNSNVTKLLLPDKPLQFLASVLVLQENSELVGASLNPWDQPFVAGRVEGALL